MKPTLPHGTLTAQRGGLARAQRFRELRQKSDAVWEIVTELDDVAPAALEATLVFISRAANAVEDVEITSALDLHRVAGAAEILHRISRLASGQSTSNVAHANTDDERAARIAELRQRLTQHDDGQVDGQADVAQ
jgi:hypothetical protein